MPGAPGGLRLSGVASPVLRHGTAPYWGPAGGAGGRQVRGAVIHGSGGARVCPRGGETVGRAFSAWEGSRFLR